MNLSPASKAILPLCQAATPSGKTFNDMVGEWENAVFMFKFCYVSTNIVIQDGDTIYMSYNVLTYKTWNDHTTFL